MSNWQVERRRRTKRLIELGGLVVKFGVVDLTGDDRAMIYGALIWMADKLNSEDGERAKTLWAEKGKNAYEAENKGKQVFAAEPAPKRSKHPPRA